MEQWYIFLISTFESIIIFYFWYSRRKSGAVSCDHDLREVQSVFPLPLYVSLLNQKLFCVGDLNRSGILSFDHDRSPKSDD